MFSKKSLRQVIAVSLLTSLTVACVKQREELAVQGSNLERLQPGVRSSDSLWQSSSTGNYVYRPTSYTLTTTEIIKPSKDTEAQKLIIEPGSPIKHLDVVGFTTDHPNLQDPNVSFIAEMLGEPGKTYQIWETLTPGYLVFNKVVSNDEISFVEKTYAQKQGDRWIVPIGGFAVSYYNVERIRNEDNRSTNLVNKYYVKPDQFRTATHFEIDNTQFQRFDRQEKVDTVERTLFEGEWYFSETVVDLARGINVDVGDLGARDTTFSDASKIKFSIKNSLLVGYNTNIDERDKNENVEQTPVIQIPVELVDYRPEFSNGQQLKEVLDDNKNDADRRFVKVEFLKNETVRPNAGILELLFGRVLEFKSLLEVTYGEDYLSFLVLDSGQRGQIHRFSFRKVKPSDAPANVQTRRYFFDDWQKFGVFFAEQKRRNDFLIATQEDAESGIRMARHNPTKDIVYHFTDQTPKDRWYRDMGREAINIWNQAFRKAGLQINIRVDESKDVPLGDIRYNVLHIVNKSIGGNLGFGPSLTDANTGLIVASSMNLTMEDINERHYAAVRNYLGRRSGKFYDFKGFDHFAPPSTKVEQLFWALNRSRYSLNNEGALSLEGFDGLAANGTRLDPNAFTENEKTLLNSLGINPSGSVDEARKVFFAQLGRAHRYQNFRLFKLLSVGSLESFAYTFSSTQVTDAFIDKHCPEVKSLSSRMSREVVDTTEEVRIIDPCVKMLSQSEGLWATIHELGHNLGLMHNFQGSADPENYPSLNDYTLQYVQYPADLLKAKTSSAMDYLSTEGRQPFPGKYDVAAIRWIYGEKVELKDGSIVSAPTDKSLIASGLAERMKPYKYCNDYDRGTFADPLCRAFDQGTSIIESAIFDIETSYNSLSYMYRYDRQGPGLPEYAILSSGLPLKNIYDQWRGFLRKHIGSTKSYLEGYTLTQYEQKIREISQLEPAQLEQFLTARNMIVKFWLDIAFLSNKYCLIKDNVTNAEKLLELEKIRTELTTAEIYSTISSCYDPAAKTFIESQGARGATLVDEFGYFLEPGKFQLDPRINFLDPFDFAGSMGPRMIAMQLLTQRITPAQKNLDQNFAPSLLDEPDLRALIQTALVNRLANGVMIARTKKPDGKEHVGRAYDYKDFKKDLFAPDYFLRGDLNESYRVKFFNNYSRESQLLTSFTADLKNAMFIPGTVDDGRQQYVTVNVGDPSQMDGIQRIASDSIEYLGNVFYVRNSNTLGGQLMKRIREIDALGELASFSPEQVSGAQVKALMELRQMGVLFVPLTNYSLLDVAKLAVKVLNRSDELMRESAENAPTAFVLNKLVEPEVALFFSVISPSVQAAGVVFEDLLAFLTEENASGDEKFQALAQLLNQPVAPAYEQLIGMGFEGVSQPTSAEMNRRYSAFVKEHLDGYNGYTYNAEEYVAQKDLLQKIILLLAR